MIVENQDVRKRRLDDLKQIHPAEIIDYGVNKALALTTEELRRVREQTTENNVLCLVTTYNPNNPQVFQLVRRTLPMLNQNSSLKSQAVLDTTRKACREKFSLELIFI